MPAVVALLGTALSTITGCERKLPDAGAASRPAAPPGRVVLYTSVDEEFARVVVDRFTQQTGVRVDAVFDSEAGKTTGLVRRLAREASAPRCDVWWSSEVFGTIELARLGALAEYDSPAAADIAPQWKDAQRRWTGHAARARVVAFDTRKLRPADLPRTWRELGQPRWAERTALANPQFGTTRGHVAAMFALWPPPAGRDLLQALRDAGARLADGNGHAVRLVAAGQAELAWTDTDDVWVAQRRGQPIDLIYPAIAEDGPPLWIPCTVAPVRGGPAGDAAKALVDFLVGPDVERILAESDSRNVPVRPDLGRELFPAGPLPQPVDYERISDGLPEAMTAARDILLR